MATLDDHTKAALLAQRVLGYVSAHAADADFKRRHALDDSLASLLAHVCDRRRRDNVVAHMELLSILTHACSVYAVRQQEHAEAWAPPRPGERPPRHLRLPDIAMWFYKSGYFVSIDRRDARWAAVVRVTGNVARDLLSVQADSAERQV